MKQTYTNPFRVILVCALAVLGFIGTSNAQVATTYTFSQSVGTYTQITGGTVVANAAMLNMDDEVFGPITIPAFAFDGVIYTQIYISTNGHLTFGAAPSTTNYLPISSTETYPGCISAFGEDIDMSVSGTRNIRYQTVGSEFVVQWQNVGRYATNDRISFQIRLNTATNQINIVYGGTITPDADTFYPEIGLRGPDNTFGTNVNNRRVVAATGAWVNSTAGTSNTSACYFNSATPGTVPAVGTTFTWTPTADLWMASLVSPGTSGCYSANQTVSVQIRNVGGTTVNFATTPVTVNCNVTGPNPQSFTPVVVNTGTLAVNASQTVTITTTYNMSVAGAYVFNANLSASGDSRTINNSISITRDGHNPSVTASADVAICNGQSTNLSTTAAAFNYTGTFANTTPLGIPDDTPAGVNSTIAVSGTGSALASSVTLRIDNLMHTFDGDLIFTITAPNGSSVIISNQNGGGGANFINTTFSTAAATNITAGTAPFTGSFQPENPFSGLTGTANGTWTLNIADNAAADVGTLNGWTLMFPVTNSISTYAWTPATGLSATNISNPVANPTSTQTYVVTVTDASGCTNSDNVIVTVNSLPTVTANVTSNTVCAGQQVTFTGGGASTYVWTGGVTNAVPFTPASTNTYTVTGTGANGCTNTATTSVTVNPIPSAPTITAGGPTTFCSGGSVVLTSSAPSGNTWSTTATTVSISVTTSGTYSVTQTVAGCTSPASAGTVVTVNPTPSAPTITAGGPTTFCSGGSVVLTSSASSGNLWSTGATTNAITVTASGTYTVTQTVGSCTSPASAGTVVTVNPTPSAPTITAGGPTTFCSGGSVVLTSSAPSGNLWSTGATTNAITVTASGTYTVTQTVGSCTSPASAGTVVTVNPTPSAPTITAGGPTTFCSGGSVVLTSSASSGNLWSTGATTNAITVTASGTYTVTQTVGSCTSPASAGTVVTVNPTPSAPTITAGGPTTFCSGGSVVLTSSASSGNLWSTGATTTSITASASGTYTVTQTVGSCTSPASAGTTVTVNSLPTVTANVTSNTVCNGGSITFTGGGATSYAWTGGVTNAVPFTPASTNTYTVTGTDGNGCANTASATVTVNALPSVTANVTSNTVCNGGSVTFTGGGATSYSWTGGVTNAVPFTPASTNTYTVTGTDGNGCTNTASTTVTVNALPSVTANVTSNTVCNGGSVTFTGGGATSYSWTGGVTNAVPFTPASTNTYTVTGTDGNGCTNTASTTVTVNPLPSVTASVTANTICNGSSVTFNGGGATTYAWTGGVTDGVPFTPSTTDTYTVTGTDGNGCTNTATTTVTVNALPSVTANVTATGVCTGNSVTFTGGGASSYTWTGGVTDGVPFTPSITDTYTVTGTDANGCSNTSTVTVTVYTSAPVTANVTATTICEGTSVTFTGGGASTYVWTGGVTDGVPFLPVSTDTYTVTGTDANGCTGTATTTVTVNAIPSVTANTTATAVCAGNSVTLTGSGASAYTWTGGVTDGLAFVPATTDTYTVTGTDGNGCSNTATVTVTVNALPVVTASASDSAICEFSQVTLTGGGALTYSWSGGATDAVPFTPIITDTYTVIGTDANGCTNTAAVTVVLYGAPVVTLSLPLDTICQNMGTITLSGETPAGGTWSGPGVSGNTFDPVLSGLGMIQIAYTYTDTNGCSAFAGDSVVVDVCNDVTTPVNADMTINAYPNPSAGVINVTFSNVSENALVLEVVDLQGQVIYSEQVNIQGDSFTKQIDLSSFANGTYFVKVTGNDVTKTMKVLKQE